MNSPAPGSADLTRLSAAAMAAAARSAVRRAERSGVALSTAKRASMTELSPPTTTRTGAR